MLTEYGPGTSVKLPALGIELPVDEVYEDIELARPATAPSV